MIEISKTVPDIIVVNVCVNYFFFLLKFKKIIKKKNVFKTRRN